MSDKNKEYQEPVKSETVTDEGRRERSLKAAAHNPNNSDEARLRAAEELAEMQKERAGVNIDPVAEAHKGDEKLGFQGGE